MAKQHRCLLDHRDKQLYYIYGEGQGENWEKLKNIFNHGFSHPASLKNYAVASREFLDADYADFAVFYRGGRGERRE
jgi:hypothetical protein